MAEIPVVAICVGSGVRPDPECRFTRSGKPLAKCSECGSVVRLVKVRNRLTTASHNAE